MLDTNKAHCVRCPDPDGNPVSWPATYVGSTGEVDEAWGPLTRWKTEAFVGPVLVVDGHGAGVRVEDAEGRPVYTFDRKDSFNWAMVVPTYCPLLTALG